MLANYFSYTPQMTAPSGLGYIASPTVSFAGIVGFIVRAGAGFYIGKFLGHPVAGAGLSAIFGVPGLFGLAVYRSVGEKATPNRRRRGRRSWRRS